MARVELTFDTDVLGLDQLQQYLYGLRELHVLSLAVELELTTRDDDLPTVLISPQQVWKLSHSAADRLGIPDDPQVLRLELRSPLLIALYTAPTLFGLARILTTLRDWPSQLERNWLENDQIRAETAAFRAQHGLSEAGNDATAQELEEAASRMPRVLRVASDDEAEPA